MDFLNNTNIVVAIGFFLFVAVVLYYGVPALLFGKLDERAAGIKSDLDEARALREEAQTLLASYERKQKEVTVQAEEIVTAARHEAEQAAAQAKIDIGKSVERRLITAGEQIAAAEQAAVRQIRDRAVAISVSAASEIIRNGIKSADSNAMVDEAIKEVGAKLH